MNRWAWLLVVASTLLPGVAFSQQATSDVSATNLDGVIKVLGSDPRGKQLLAAVVLLKGIGHQEGDTVTWHVEFRDGHLLVNGMDMSLIMPRQKH